MVVWCIATPARKQEAPLVVFTGGGTGGHVYPALAVARELAKRRDVRLLWIGSRGLEQDIVAREGIPYLRIPAGKLRRYLSLRNFSDLLLVVMAVLKCIAAVGFRKPAVMFSKGGFVSVPPVIAAKLWSVPVVTHESDADPGLATRINSRFSSHILVPYAATADHFGERLRERVEVTGIPLRTGILEGNPEAGLKLAGFSADDRRPVLLVLGGSQGSLEINQMIWRNLDSLGTQWRIIHQVGQSPTDVEIPAETTTYCPARYFSSEMPDVLAASDAVLCRAGATTLWEAAAVSLAMVLLPLRAGSRGDQVLNAALFASRDAAIHIDSRDQREEHALAALKMLAGDAARRQELGRNARNLIQIDSTDRIVTILSQMLLR